MFAAINLRHDGTYHSDKATSSIQQNKSREMRDFLTIYLKTKTELYKLNGANSLKLKLLFKVPIHGKAGSTLTLMDLHPLNQNRKQIVSNLRVHEVCQTYRCTIWKDYKVHKCRMSGHEHQDNHCSVCDIFSNTQSTISRQAQKCLKGPSQNASVMHIFIGLQS